jgi:two-component system OmpR family response regulator
VKVLIVEDDAKLARFLCRVMTEEGWAADLCTSGSDGVAQAKTGLYDVVVLDWMLPDGDGLHVCKELRKAGIVTPILMLTARGETRERVLGLDSGADDYMVKPFEVEELVARVKALTRRNASFANLKVGELEIDRLGRRAYLKGQALDLTSREYALLLYFANGAGKTISRTALLSHVWEQSFDPGSNLIEVHISRLRDKLGEYSWMIETVRGVGYRLRSDKP